MNALRKIVAAPFFVFGVLLLAIGSILVYGFKGSSDIFDDISNVYESYDY